MAAEHAIYRPNITFYQKKLAHFRYRHPWPAGDFLVTILFQNIGNSHAMFIINKYMWEYTLKNFWLVLDIFLTLLRKYFPNTTFLLIIFAFIYDSTLRINQYGADRPPILWGRANFPQSVLAENSENFRLISCFLAWRSGGHKAVKYTVSFS